MLTPLRLLIAAGLVTLVGCGSAKQSEAPKVSVTSGAPKGSAALDSTTSAPNKDTTAAPASPQTSGSDFCALAKKQFDDLPTAMKGVIGASPTEQARIIEAISTDSDKIVAKAPAALKSDLVLANDAAVIARQMLTNPADTALSSKLSELVARPDFVAAGKRLSEYYKTNCGFDPESLAGG